MLLDFWATWCTPCLAELPNVRRAFDKYGGGGDFVIVAVSLDDDVNAVRRFLASRNLAWTQIVGGPTPDNKIAALYNVSSVPATFLLDRDGKVVAKDLRGAGLHMRLAQLLAPPTAAAQP